MYFFIVYLRTLKLAKNIGPYCPVVGWLLVASATQEAWFEIMTPCLLGGIEEIQFGLWAEIWTQDFPNKKL